MSNIIKCNITNKNKKFYLIVKTQDKILFPSKMNYKPEKAISLEDFYMLCVIGKGSYAKVVLVKRKDTGEIMALKILKKEMIEKRKQEEHVRTEREVLVSPPRI